MFKAKNLQRNVYRLSAVIAVMYLGTNFLVPVDQATLITYNISEFQLRLLLLPLQLMIVAIWLCTAYGFTHFKRYALLIKGTPDGEGINTLANGLGIIALQLVLSTVLSAITAFDVIKSGLGGGGTVIMLSTFIGVVFNLWAFFVLNQGAKRLVNTLSTSKRATRPSTATMVLTAILGLVYVILLANSYPASTTADSVYHHLSLPFALALLAVPYIATWYFALSAAQKLSYYKLHVDGIIYQDALQLFARGIYVIIFCTIFAQILGTLGSSLENLAIAPMAALLYVLIAALGFGFVFTAQSAKKLRKIEEL